MAWYNWKEAYWKGWQARGEGPGCQMEGKVSVNHGTYISLQCSARQGRSRTAGMAEGSSMGETLRERHGNKVTVRWFGAS